MWSDILLAMEGLFRKRQRVRPADVKQVLILEYRLPLGCLVHLTPVFEAIKQSRPELEITVATCGLGLQVLRHTPFVDHLIETPDPTTYLRGAVLALRKELHNREIYPDCVLTGMSDQRTLIALMGLLGAGGWRGGFTQKPWLYHRPLVPDAGQSLIGNNLALAKLLDCNLEINRPRVFFSDADAKFAASMLLEANPAGKPLAVLVTQNSGGQKTGWHLERFVQVIRHVAVMRGYAVLYVGTAMDRAPIEAIRTAAGGIGTSIAGRTSASQLAAVLALSDLVITLDTGTMHVGRSTGVPMAVLGPSWQKPLEWMPLGLDNVRILRGEDRDDVPPGYKLDEISAAEVIAAIEGLMEHYPATAQARQTRLQEGLSQIDHLQTGTL